ncbi:MAG: hypothetical protein H7123_04950, partial [Thermoleophilia bacterium]|nr:hypothetical protein [Thermoleophilia bacterium]
MAGLWQNLEDFSGITAAATQVAGSQRRIERAVFPEIKRRSVISMRDPQQPDLEDFTAVRPEPVHAPVPTAEDVYREAQATADLLLAEARATAQSMVEQARMSRDAELEAARVEGKREGYEAGYGDGMGASDRETAGLISTAEQIALHVSREREALLESSECELVELALSIASRVVNAAIEVDPSLVVDVCRGAMRKAFQRESL